MKKIITNIVTWERPLAFHEIVVMCSMLIFVKLAYGIVVIHFLYHPMPSTGTLHRGISILSATYPITLLLNAVAEEFLYRLLPFLLATILLCLCFKIKSQKVINCGVLTALVISSIVFGWVHGGAVNILIQGVGGIVYSLIFLRITLPTDDPLEGMFASAGTHFSSNLIFSIILLSMGQYEI